MPKLSIKLNLALIKHGVPMCLEVLKCFKTCDLIEAEKSLKTETYFVLVAKSKQPTDMYICSNTFCENSNSPMTWYCKSCKCFTEYGKYITDRYHAITDLRPLWKEYGKHCLALCVSLNKNTFPNV